MARPSSWRAGFPAYASGRPDQGRLSGRLLARRDRTPAGACGRPVGQPFKPPFASTCWETTSGPVLQPPCASTCRQTTVGQPSQPFKTPFASTCGQTTSGTAVQAAVCQHLLGNDQWGSLPAVVCQHLLGNDQRADPCSRRLPAPAGKRPVGQPASHRLPAPAGKRPTCQPSQPSSASTCWQTTPAWRTGQDWRQALSVVRGGQGARLPARRVRMSAGRSPGRPACWSAASTRRPAPPSWRRHSRVLPRRAAARATGSAGG
jgi:hypothetical protein